MAELELDKSKHNLYEVLGVSAKANRAIMADLKSFFIRGHTIPEIIEFFYDKYSSQKCRTLGVFYIGFLKGTHESTKQKK